MYGYCIQLCFLQWVFIGLGILAISGNRQIRPCNQSAACLLFRLNSFLFFEWVLFVWIFVLFVCHFCTDIRGLSLSHS